MQDIDLPPHNWKSDRPKPKEPIFGPGLPYGISVVVGIGVAAYLIHDFGWHPAFSGIAASCAAFLAYEFSANLKS